MMITIFTPTYNRAHLLPKLYESLCRQIYSDFEWVIVDDGSVDNTEEVVNSQFTIHNSQLKVDNSNSFASSLVSQLHFPIRYFYQENGGKHRAINRGVKEARGELFFIADSDDWLPEDALAIVAEEYAKIKDDKTVAGVAGLDCYEKGDVVGSGLPKETINCNAIDIRLKHHVTGDLKEVFRTSVLREFPFPEIEGERFCPEQLVWFRIAQKYKLHYFNQPIYIAAYQEQGITAGIVKARMKSPIASMMCYQELNGYAVPFPQKMKAAINYWRFRLCSKKGHKHIPHLSWWWNWVMPLGWLLHLNDKRKV